MSVLIINVVVIIIISDHSLLILLILKRAFKWACQCANLTKQPTTVLD